MEALKNCAAFAPAAIAVTAAAVMAFNDRSYGGFLVAAVLLAGAASKIVGE